MWTKSPTIDTMQFENHNDIVEVQRFAHYRISPQDGFSLYNFSTKLCCSMQHIKSSHRTLSRGLLKSITFGESIMTITDYGRFPHLSFAYSEIQSVDTEVPLKNCISSDFCERGQRGGKDLGEVKRNCSKCSSWHCYLVGVKKFSFSY